MDCKCKRQRCDGFAKAQEKVRVLPGGQYSKHTNQKLNNRQGTGAGTPVTREEERRPHVRPPQSGGLMTPGAGHGVETWDLPGTPVGGQPAATAGESEVAIPAGAGTACAPRAPPGDSLRASQHTLTSAGQHPHSEGSAQKGPLAGEVGERRHPDNETPNRGASGRGLPVSAPESPTHAVRGKST